MSKVQKLQKNISLKEDQSDDLSPYLCVDFVLKHGFVFLLIRNLSALAATQVQMTFNQHIRILESSKSLADLSIFSKLAYLAPLKEIEVYLDPAELFLSQFKDTVVVINITYTSEREKRFKKTITHDLAIYRDLPILLNPHQNE
ncbi:hypothetical protein [Catalinimonas niigatensis]|uniref:hypothetical protein n=1 Tax=Catalinimonas niigatensis TaxID=1397264 RepID=UPI002664EF1C|nr:hypothetical protein [Catalinimonas niigatensis]WPP48340.1 hypothetical protein PZB72_16835 [Catalinimonas niigatensis]